MHLIFFLQLIFLSVCMFTKFFLDFLFKFHFTFLRAFPNKSIEWISLKVTILDKVHTLMIAFKNGLAIGWLLLLVFCFLDFICVHFIKKKRSMWIGDPTHLIDFWLRLFVVIILIAHIANRWAFVHQRLLPCPMRERNECKLEEKRTRKRGERK